MTDSTITPAQEAGEIRRLGPRPPKVRQKISRGVSRSLVTQWKDPVIRERRATAIRAAWTPERRQQQAEICRDRIIARKLAAEAIPSPFPGYRSWSEVKATGGSWEEFRRQFVPAG